MSDIFNKYIFTYIYIICLFHFVANEENDEKFFLRFNDGEKEWEWEFKLFFDTEGGQELYNRLKSQTNIELIFDNTRSIDLLSYQYDSNFNCLLKTNPSYTDYGFSDIFTTTKYLIIHIKKGSGRGESGELIGSIINFSSEPFNNIDDKSKIKLEFALVKIPNTAKIAKFNKKIIVTVIIGVLILIIFIILKIID